MLIKCYYIKKNVYKRFKKVTKTHRHLVSQSR